MRRKLWHTALVMVLGLSSKGFAGTIWYNGDPDLVDGLASEINTTIPDAWTFDDFQLTSTTRITGVFGNFFVSTGGGGAYWEIRSGVSAGDGGTLLSGDIESVYLSANGFDAYGYTGYYVEISIPEIVLPAGTYWLSIALNGDGTGRSFVQTTSGANAIGTPQGDNFNAFFNSNHFGTYFVPSTTQVASSDFSYGIYGEAAAPVPEPASLTMLVAGAVMFGAIRRRRPNSRRSEPNSPSPAST